MVQNVQRMGCKSGGRRVRPEGRRREVVATGRRRRIFGLCTVPSAPMSRQNKSRSRPTRSGRAAY
eukprot:8307987-Pyramimonas_sp.AAC.1